MPKVNKYNVYDNGNLILENVTQRMIVNTLGCTTISIPKYAEERMKWQKRYSFERCGVETPETIETAFAREWNAVVALFKNVIWVKKGGRKLCISKF